MSYSQFVPHVMQAITESRARRSPNFTGQLGRALLQSPQPRFESPWAQIATNFATALLGSGLTSYGQQQQAAQDAIANEQISQALASEQPTQALQDMGYSDIASQLQVMDLLAERERDAMLQDPSYMLKERELAANMDYRDRALGLQERELGASLASAAATRELAQAQNANRMYKEVFDITDKGAQAMRALEKEAKSDPAIKLYKEYDSKLRTMESLMAQMEKGGDSAKFAAYKAFVEFAKNPGEALMSDDVQNTLNQMGLSGSLNQILQYVGSDGQIPVDEVPAMYGALQAIATAMKKRAEDTIATDYMPRAQNIKNMYKNPYGETPEHLKVRSSGLTSMISEERPASVPKLASALQESVAKQQSQAQAQPQPGLLKYLFGY